MQGHMLKVLIPIMKRVEQRIRKVGIEARQCFSEFLQGFIRCGCACGEGGWEQFLGNLCQICAKLGRLLAR
jgi:hypothetical protein